MLDNSFLSRRSDQQRISNLPDEALVSVATFAALTEQSVSTVWRKLATDLDYPATVRLGNRCTRVRMGDIRKLIASKAVSK
jgi:predicted DNA-binding transcriptional regulator AlpA